MKDPKAKLPVTRPDSAYDVGYGKPPKQTRFALGKSGNPKGRPKGAKNKRPALNEERLKDIVLDEAYRDITVRDGNRNVSMPMARAVVRALAVNAAKGQHRAQRLFAEMLTTTERQNKALADAWLNTAMDYKIEWDEELRRRERHGITDLPDPLPHPDQVKFDMNTGQAWVEGPMTKDEKAELERWIDKRDDFLEEVEYLRGELKTVVNDKRRAFLENDLAQTQKMPRHNPNRARQDWVHGEDLIVGHCCRSRALQRTAAVSPLQPLQFLAARVLSAKIAATATVGVLSCSRKPAVHALRSKVGGPNFRVAGRS